MKIIFKALIQVFLVLVLFGCNSSENLEEFQSSAASLNSLNEGKIEGTKWISEKLSHLGLEDQITVEFLPSGGLIYKDSLSTNVGTYRLLEDYKVVLTFSHSHFEEIIKINGNTLSMTDVDGGAHLDFNFDSNIEDRVLFNLQNSKWVPKVKSVNVDGLQFNGIEFKGNSVAILKIDNNTIDSTYNVENGMLKLFFNNKEYEFFLTAIVIGNSSDNSGADDNLKVLYLKMIHKGSDKVLDLRPRFSSDNLRSSGNQGEIKKTSEKEDYSDYPDELTFTMNVKKFPATIRLFDHKSYLSEVTVQRAEVGYKYAIAWNRYHGFSWATKDPTFFDYRLPYCVFSIEIVNKGGYKSGYLKLDDKLKITNFKNIFKGKRVNTLSGVENDPVVSKYRWESIECTNVKNIEQFKSTLGLN